MQNMFIGPAISDPHLHKKMNWFPFSFLVSFIGVVLFYTTRRLVVFLAVFLVFLAAFLGLAGFFFAISPTSPSSVMVKPSAPAFIPDLLRYCLSYSSSSCWRDFLPVPACTCLGFGAGGSGADGVGGELDPAFFAPQLVQNFHRLPFSSRSLSKSLIRLVILQVSDVVALGSNPCPDKPWIGSSQIPGRRCTASCKSLACA